MYMYSGCNAYYVLQIIDSHLQMSFCESTSPFEIATLNSKKKKQQ